MAERERSLPARIEQSGCPTCAVPAGSACRTASGNTAFRYHTARLLQVPGLTEPEVAVPAERGPGTPWHGPNADEAGRDRRFGYARGERAEDARDQLHILRTHGCERLFVDHAGLLVAARPERDRALAAAEEAARAAAAAGRGSATVTVLALNELAGNSAELADVAARLAAADVCLDILTGPLAGLHDPRGSRGSAQLFTVLAAASMLDHAFARERNAAGRRAADAQGRRSGRPRVIDDDLLAAALALRDEGVPVPEIARRLVIPGGKHAGDHPSLASVYRALATHDARTAVSHDLVSVTKGEDA